MPEAIAVVMSARLATPHELDTVYGAKDLYDMLEVVTVDAYNHALASRQE